MAKQQNVFKRIGAAIQGKSAGVSDERGWFDLTNSKQGGSPWNEADLIQQYSTSVYVFRSVKVIADTIGSIEYNLHRITNTKGDVQEVQMHPILDLMYRPNPFQTWTQFIKITSTNKSLTGEAYWHKVRNNAGQVVELWNIRPDLMRPIAHSTEYISHYEFTAQGNITRFEVADIVHLFDTNPIDNRTGVAALQAAKDRVQVEEYANEYQRNFFLNNARPDALLSNPETWSDEQKAEMRLDWNQKFQGRGNNSKIAFLEGGTQYQQVSTTQKEMDFIESMKFTRDDILVAFGVPKGLIISDDVNLANGEMAMQSFMTNTIDPEAKQIFEAINEQLIRKDFGEEYFIEYVSPIPEKREALALEIKELTDLVYTRNESRLRLGLEPVEGGDVLTAEFSKVPLTTLGGNPFAKTYGGQKVFIGRKSLYKNLKTKEDLTKSIEDAVEKAVENYKKSKKAKDVADVEEYKEPQTVSFFKTTESREAYELNINKGIDRRASGFGQKLSEIFDNQEKRVAEKLDEIAAADAVTEELIFDVLKIDDENQIFKSFMQPVYEDIAVSAGEQGVRLIEGAKKAEVDFVITQVLKALLLDRVAFFADSVNSTTFKALTANIIEGVKAGEGVDKLRGRVSSVYGDIKQSRAELIARTESTFASNAGFQESYAVSKVVNGKEWVATLDSRVRDAHLKVDGEIVGVYDSFSNGLEYPQEPNCRCVIAPALIKE